MKTVYKYPLKIDDYQQVNLPMGAKILCIKAQNGIPCLWALIDKEQIYNETVTIRCAGTGHDIKDEVELDNHTIMEEIRKCGCNPNEFDVAKHFFELGLKAKQE